MTDICSPWWWHTSPEQLFLDDEDGIRDLGHLGLVDRSVAPLLEDTPPPAGHCRTCHAVRLVASGCDPDERKRA